MSSLTFSTAIFLPNPNLLPLRRRPPSTLHLLPRRATTTSISAALVSPPPTIASSTQTLTSLLSLILSASKSLANILTAAPSNLAPSFSTAGTLFFARIRDQPVGNLNTPLTLVAAGISKWLDIYSGVLLVRVLLSWFPNIPWDRQPLSAIRDLCDPYLNLFRNIIPPVFDTLDVSPLLAFAVLGVLGTILNSGTGGTGMY